MNSHDPDQPTSRDALASDDLLGAANDEILPPVEPAPQVWKPKQRETAGLEQPLPQPVVQSEPVVPAAAPAAADAPTTPPPAAGAPTTPSPTPPLPAEPSAAGPPPDGATSAPPATAPVPDIPPPTTTDYSETMAEDATAERPFPPVSAAPAPAASAPPTVSQAPPAATPHVASPQQVTSPAAPVVETAAPRRSGLPGWLLPGVLLGLVAIVGIGALTLINTESDNEVAAPATPTTTESDATSVAGQAEAEPQAAAAPTTVPEPEPTVEPEPEPTVEPEPEPTVEPEPTTEPEQTIEPESEATTEPEPTVAVLPVEAVADLPDLDSLPERGAYYREGILYLEGAVPNDEIAQQFADKAAAVIGADSVVNNYVIHPDAPIPTDGNVVVESAVLFDVGSSVIRDEFTQILGLGIIVMRTNPQVTMVVEGHTDSTGPDDLNLQLSSDRAEAAVEFIVASGIDASRFVAVGKGESEPVADNDTEEGRSVNRRIEVELLDLLLDE